jgi:Helix-turn-helix.
MYKNAENHLRNGGIIPILRSHKNMSQGDLGKLLGVTSKYINDMEHGRRAVSLKMAKKLSVIFNRRTERFLPL